MPSLKRRATAGALWLSVETWGQQLLQFALFAVLARLLGPEAYGLLAMAMLVTTFANMLILNGGWIEALIQRRELDPRHIDSVFWVLLASSAALALLTMLLARPLATAFAEPELAAVTVWMSLVMPLSALCVVPSALLRRAFRFAPLAAQTLIATTAAGLIAVPMALAGFGVWSLVVFQLALPAFQAIVLWTAHPWRPGLRISWSHLAEITGFVGGVLGERALLAVDAVVPRAFVGAAVGTAALGHFTTARKILDLLIQLLIRPVSHVAMPSFADAAGDRSRTQPMLDFGPQAAALVAFPGHIGLALVARDLVPLVFGSAWLPVVPILQVMALYGFILPLVMVTTALMHGTGRTFWQLALGASSTTLFVVLLLAMGEIGLMQAAIAYVARGFLIFPLRMWAVQRITGVDIRPALWGSLRLVVATGVMAAAVLALQSATAGSLSPALAVLASAAVGAVAYGLAVLLLARPLVVQLTTMLRALAKPRSTAPAADPADVPAV